MTSERKFIAENIRRVLLKEYLMQKTERAGFGDLDIQRTPLGTRVTLIAERPGMVIGRKGATIKELTKVVEEDFKFDNPQIEVQEADNPNLNPQIMAQKLVSALERGWHFRRAGHSTVRQIMAAGAKGCQVIISGKLTGQRHRVEKFKEGHIKFCGEPKKQWMHEGFAVAKKKLGIIGVKVQIMDPNAKLPDEVEIIPDNELQVLLKSQAEEAAAAAAEAEKAAAEDGGAATALKKPKRKSKKKAEEEEVEEEKKAEEDAEKVEPPAEEPAAVEEKTPLSEDAEKEVKPKRKTLKKTKKAEEEKAAAEPVPEPVPEAPKPEAPAPAPEPAPKPEKVPAPEAPKPEAPASAPETPVSEPKPEEPAVSKEVKPETKAKAKAKEKGVEE